jgi:hypothetical protein
MIKRKKLWLCSAGLIALLLAACTAGESAAGIPLAPTATAPRETPTASPPTATEPAATPAGEDAAPEEAAAEADAAAIYAAVVRQLYEVDHSFDQPPNWPYLYILGETDDSIAGLGEIGASESIPPAAQEAITEMLADLPAEITWVESWDDVPVEEEGGAVREGNGVIFTLGNIHPTDDEDTVEVPSGLYCGGLCGTGMTYIVERQGDMWVVTGVTGPVWIS